MTRAPVMREHNYDAVADVVHRKVDKTQGRISAKRLLPIAQGPRWDRRDHGRSRQRG